MSDPEIQTGNTILRGKDAFRAAGWALPLLLLLNALRPWLIAGLGASTWPLYLFVRWLMS